MSQRNGNSLYLSSDQLLIPLLEDEDVPVEIGSSLGRLFNLIFDNVLENDRFNEAVQNSMNTYNEEIFKRKNDYELDLFAEEVKAESEFLDKKCFICLDPILLGNKIFPLPCRHTFHEECLKEAVAHQHYQCCLCHSKFPIQKVKKWLEDEYETEEGHKICFSVNSSFSSGTSNTENNDD